jgi:hypothetical protein
MAKEPEDRNARMRGGWQQAERREEALERLQDPREQERDWEKGYRAQVSDSMRNQPDGGRTSKPGAGRRLPGSYGSGKRSR